MFWFCSDNKLRYQNVCVFLSISLSTASRKKERKNMQTTPPFSKYFLKNSPYIRGAVDSPHHWYGESSTHRIGDTGSRYLREKKLVKRRSAERKNMQTTPASSKYFLKNSSYTGRAVDSPHHWYKESSTLRIGDKGSRRLRVSLIRGVHIWEKKICLALIFRTLPSRLTIRYF